MVPPLIWKAMLAAPRIVLSAPQAARAAYLAANYAGVVADRPWFDAALERLPGNLPKQTLADWRALADAGDLEALAAGLMEAHYDPAYDRAARKEERPRLGAVGLAALDDAALDAAARQVAEFAGR